MNKKLFISMVLMTAIVGLLFVVGCHKENGGNNNGGYSGSKPNAPSGLYVINSSSSSVSIGWNSVSNADYYNIYRATSAYGSYSSLGYVSSSKTSYTDNNPNSGDNYYKVTAENDYGESSYSAYLLVNVSNNGGGGGGTSSSVSAPTGVNASKDGTRVYVSWNSVSGASYYKVYRASSSSGSYSLLSSNVSNTYYYDNSPLSSNYYKVTAVSSSGNESEKSSYAYCAYSGGGGGGGTSVPSAPTGVTASNYGSTMVPNVYISWNSVTGATSYKVYRSSSASGSYSQIGSATSSTYAYDGNPMSGKNYYKVKAVNSAGESSYSSYAMFDNDQTQVSPCPPTVSASGNYNSVTVSWSSSSTSGCGKPTSYEVHKYDPNSSSWVLKTTTSSTSYRDNNPHPGINKYAVKAINQYGSDVGYGYTSSISLPKPSSFTAQKSGNDRIIFTWSKVDQATGYDIFKCETSSYGTYTTFQGTTDNVTTLNVYFPGESGHTYYFKIRAYYKQGYGDYVFSDFTTYKSVTF